MRIWSKTWAGTAGLKTFMTSWFMGVILLMCGGNAPRN
jgi:hypothetical protein